MNLRTAARGKPCTLRILGVCRDDPEHKLTVLNHINGLRQDTPVMFAAASGTGTKSDDRAAVYGCGPCHDVIDRRQQGGKHGWGQHEKERWWYLANALIETRILQEEDK